MKSKKKIYSRCRRKKSRSVRNDGVVSSIPNESHVMVNEYLKPSDIYNVSTLSRLNNSIFSESKEFLRNRTIKLNNKFSLLSLNNENFIEYINNIKHLYNVTFLYNYDKQIEQDGNGLFLDLSNMNIIDLTPLEYIDNIDYYEYIKTLYLNNNQIEDISHLKNFNQLNYLFLNNNQIEDISILQNFNNLIELDLSNNVIIDISSLQNLNNLRYLSLNDNQIKDIRKLRLIIPNLRELNWTPYF
jgi:hypothetical protein